MTPEVREHVTLELRELEAKIAALRAFLHTPAFYALVTPRRSLLVRQLHPMKEYAAVLRARLDLCPPRFEPALY